MSKSKKLQNLYKKMIFTVILLFFIFGLPALLSTVLGDIIDERLNIKPFGTLAFLFISYILSWVIVFALYRFIKANKSIIFKVRKNE